jgi:hypothetical protein
MPDIIKMIKHPEDSKLGKKTSMEEFVDVCNKKPSDKSFEKKSIKIKEAPNPKDLKLTELDETLIVLPKDLSFEISAADTKKIFEQLVGFTTNARLVAESLKDLDKALGDSFENNNLQFDKNDLPEYIIAGKGHYIPGPPPKDYLPKKKEKLLDKLLLEREGKNKINVEGETPKFVGFVEHKKAIPFIASGHLFAEDKQVSQVLLHGSYSHRIMFEAICQAKESGKLNFEYGEGKELTPLQLLELLITTKYYPTHKDQILEQNEQTLWELTLDTVTDSVYAPEAKKNYLNDENYSSSCRSPFVLNSLLLNFGEELGLSNLQHYLLDSHWKAAYEMVYRVKKAMSSTDIPDEIIYTYCMEALTTASNNLGEIGVNLPFTLTESETQKDSKYVPFNSEESIQGIVKKIKNTYGTGEYSSWQEYIDRKSEKTEIKTEEKKTEEITKEITVEEKKDEIKIEEKKTEEIIKEIKKENVEQKKVAIKEEKVTNIPNLNLEEVRYKLWKLVREIEERYKPNDWIYEKAQQYRYKLDEQDLERLKMLQVCMWTQENNIISMELKSLVDKIEEKYKSDQKHPLYELAQKSHHQWNEEDAKRLKTLKEAVQANEELHSYAKDLKIIKSDYIDDAIERAYKIYYTKNTSAQDCLEYLKQEFQIVKREEENNFVTIQEEYKNASLLKGFGLFKKEPKPSPLLEKLRDFDNSHYFVFKK